MRLACAVRALSLAAVVFIPIAEARGQTRSRGGGGPDKADTIPSTRVILVPAVDKYDVSRLGIAIKDKKVLAIYATDGPVARALATKLQANHGGSVIPFARADTAREDFAHTLADSIVEKTARREMQRTILVVAEPDLFRAFLIRAVGDRAGALVDEDGPIHTFIITVRADNRRTLAASR